MKRTWRIVDFAVQADYWRKISESEKKRRVLRPCQRAKKAV